MKNNNIDITNDNIKPVPILPWIIVIYLTLSVVSVIFIIPDLTINTVSVKNNQLQDGNDRGVSQKLTAKELNYISGYQGSYALVIGVSNYTHGWRKLSAVLKETQEVKAALEKNGFEVTYVTDPDDIELQAAFENFITKYGYKKENRLLFFFSGHGHTRDNNNKGYLVPINAPDPKDDIGFQQKAVSMEKIISWSKEIEAKHALFLFDSCFSGTVFSTRSLSNLPLHISRRTVRPVRQYITAGDAGEEVPAKSVFTPVFIEALNGAADLNKDGYIIGTELGMYLHDRVIYFNKGQTTPQYGKIRDPELSKGNFVFKVRSNDKSN